MDERWKDLGENANLFDSAVDVATLGHNPFPRDHSLQDKETGEVRTVFVGPGQTVGDAIAKGQFNKK